jgi:hypothetical protein
MAEARRRGAHKNTLDAIESVICLPDEATNEQRRAAYTALDVLAILADGGGRAGIIPTAKRRRGQNRKLTEIQLEALKVVGECKRNFSEAARELKRNPKTVRQNFRAGLKNAGRLARKLIGKPKTKTLPTDPDEHAQVSIAGKDDGPAPSTTGNRIRRDQR